MIEQIKVIVIDPIARKVSEKMIDNTLEALQAIVEGYIESGVVLHNGDQLLVNENGGVNTKWKELGAAFALNPGDGQPRFFVGPGVLIGVSRNGNSIDTKTDLQVASAMVHWP